MSQPGYCWGTRYPPLGAKCLICLNLATVGVPGISNWVSCVSHVSTWLLLKCQASQIGCHVSHMSQPGYCWVPGISNLVNLHGIELRSQPHGTTLSLHDVQTCTLAHCSFLHFFQYTGNNGQYQDTLDSIKIYHIYVCVYGCDSVSPWLQHDD